VLFPQSAYPSSGGGWVVPLHAWVVELEKGSLSRRIGQRALLELLDISGVVDTPEDADLFRHRISWFMADREINKKVSIQIGGEIFTSPRSGRNGHVEFEVNYHGAATEGSMLECNVVNAAPGSVQSPGFVQLVPARGLSVISDIDDTIKISNVTRKRDLVKGVFFDQYRETPGFPDFYYSLQKLDVCFHYVSSSPWQLYPSLSSFLGKYYPDGSVSQRHFYVGDESFVRFFLNSMDYKIKTIGSLLQRFPERRFVLIGDSGEKDPEIYLQIARDYGNQIVAILIRDIFANESIPGTEIPPEDDKSETRWQSIRSRLPADFPAHAFRVVHHPAEVGDVQQWLASFER